MKTFRVAALAEFQIRQPENRLRIESRDNEFVILAQLDNFTEEQKTRFVRYLAVEGFIPAHYGWFNPCSPYSSHLVRWVVTGAAAATPVCVSARIPSGRGKNILQAAASLSVFLAVWLACVMSCFLFCDLFVWPWPAAPLQRALGKNNPAGTTPSAETSSKRDYKAGKEVIEHPERH